jgi:WD40 repeat protein/transcriptional regulator with XRE-family HTH domain
MDTGTKPVFGDWIRQRRKELDLTQEELAEQSGCSVDMVRRVEHGTARPSRQLAELLGTSLKVSQEEIAPFVQWARTGVRERAGETEQPPQPLDAGPDQPTDSATAPTEIRNPYKGLRPFSENDASDFFGREALTQHLLGRMAEDSEMARFLAVVGPSGSGKSSVVRAGVVPAVRQGSLPGAMKWTILDMIPGMYPFEEMEATLLRVAVNPPASLLPQLVEDERGMLRAIKRVLPADPDASLLLVVDQFEEVFTLVEDEAVRKRFLDGLYVAATDPRSPLHVVVTLRADFYDRPLLYRQPGELMRQRMEVVLPMSGDELERAVVRPAARVGVTLEQDLLAAIIQDVTEQPGALPLMQYALTELFERRAGMIMTLQAYRESGGVAGALSRRAEAIFNRLGPVEQETARQLFLRLVTPGEGAEDTRRRIRRSEIATAAPDESALDHVLEIFGSYRLLTFDRDPIMGRPTVEIAHEALIKTWPRLREWLDASRESLRVQRRLLAAAGEWAETGQDPSFLAHGGVRLAQFEALEATGEIALNEQERAYVAASVSERDRAEEAERERQKRELESAQQVAKVQRSAARRLRFLAGALGVFLLVAAGLAAIAFNSQGEANAQRRQAESDLARTEALRLAAEANTLLQTHKPTELAALLDIRSLRTQYTAQGDFVLGQLATLEYPQAHFGPQSGSVMGVAFSPDGKTVLTAHFGGNVARLWDVSSGQVLKVFSGHDKQLTSVAYSPDGKWALTGSNDSTARLWDVKSGKQLREFDGHTGPVFSVAFSPDGKRIVTGSADGTARLWDAASGGQLEEQFAGSGRPVDAVAFSPDGKSLLIGGADGSVRVWDIESSKQTAQFTGPAANVTSVAFSPDGAMVLAASEDKMAYLWDVKTARQLHVFSGHTDIVTDAAFSPDGKTLLTSGADKTARLWDTQTGQELQDFLGHSDIVTSVAFSPDGGKALTGSLDRTALLWNLNSHPEPPVLSGHTDVVWTVDFSPDGKSLLTASADKTATLWDVATGTLLRTFSGHANGLEAATFSRDGKLIVTASDDGTARVWDAASGKQLMELTGYNSPVISAVFSPDGKWILTGSADNTARVWDAQTGSTSRIFTGHTGAVVDAIFSPDGKSILTTSDDKSVRLWDAASATQTLTFTGHTANVKLAAFSPDGKLAATASDDHTVRIWDVRTGQELRELAGHSDVVYGVAFSPDGKTVLSGSWDGTARIWDVSTGVELRRFGGHTDAVNGVAFSPDGKLVATASTDRTARLWNVSYVDTVNGLCKRLARDFSPDELLQYTLTEDSPTCPK